MIDERKAAAIMAAVSLYMQSEVEAMLQPARPEPEAPAAPLRLWGVAGRQSTMQLRNMMQLKAFHGSRLR